MKSIKWSCSAQGTTLWVWFINKISNDAFQIGYSPNNGVGATYITLGKASLEKIAAKGRVRRAEEEKRKREREWLKAVGFSDNEIDEIY